MPDQSRDDMAELAHTAFTDGLSAMLVIGGISASVGAAASPVRSGLLAGMTHELAPR